MIPVKRQASALVVLVCMCFLGRGLVASPITVDFWSMSASACDYGEGMGCEDVSTTEVVMPLHLTQFVHVGGSWNETVYALELLQHGARLGLAFDHVRDGDGSVSGFYQRDSAGSIGTVIFTATETVPYRVGGSYGLDGAGEVALKVRLGGTGQIPVFDNGQVSRSTADEQLTVGHAGGDDHNTLNGQASGFLEAGKQYEFFYNYGIATMASDTGATASGTLTLTILPEPDAAVLAWLAVILFINRH